MVPAANLWRCLQGPEPDTVAAILTKEGVESGKGVDLYGSLEEFKLALPENELQDYERRRPQPVRDDDAWEEPPRAATVG